MQFGEIILPVVRPVNAWGAVGGVQPHTLGRVERPAANVQLPAALVRQRDATGAEYVRLDVHRAPGCGEVAHQREVQLVRACGV